MYKFNYKLAYILNELLLKKGICRILLNDNYDFQKFSDKELELI